MTNFSRLHNASKAELAEELTRLKNSEMLAYADMTEWLGSRDTALQPHGRRVLADIAYRNSFTRQVSYRTCIDCIIISDNETLFGERYYKIYDMTDGKIKSVPFANIEVVDYE